MSKRTRWTPGRDRQLIDMYEANTPASVIAGLMGCSTDAIYTRISRIGLTDPERNQALSKERRDPTQKAYQAGDAARMKGRPCSPPSKYEPALRAFWLAGWHDADMELGVSVLEGVA